MLTLNFMWMHEMSIGLMAVSKSNSFLNNFLPDVSDDKEYVGFKEILGSMFILDKTRRIKVGTVMKKLRREINASKTLALGITNISTDSSQN